MIEVSKLVAFLKEYYIQTIAKFHDKGRHQFGLNCAGSFPLWLKLHETNDFKPNDCDIFVTGISLWEYEEVLLQSFQEYCNEFNEKDMDANDHEKVVSVKGPVMRVLYCRRKRTYLCDFQGDFFGLEKSSFIWQYGSGGMESVLEGFDINVCQIGYNFVDGSFHVSEEVEDAITTREAKIIDFNFSSLVPSIANVRVLGRSLLRMNKYHSRGFNFREPPKIRFGVMEDYDEDSKMSIVTSQNRDDEEGQDPNIILDYEYTSESSKDS